MKYEIEYSISHMRGRNAALMDSMFSNVFFFFFVAQIFSPYIGGVTLYIEPVVALMNPRFIKWIISGRVPIRPLSVGVLLFGLSAILDMGLIPKIASGVISIMYLCYSYESKTFYLIRYVILSTIFALLQFIFLYINPSISMLIGPQALSELVWGQYATPSFSNFYSILGITRVSGLSRESGFFASLIVSTAALILVDSSLKIGKTKKSILAVGWLISLSKMSLLGIIIYFAVKARRVIDVVPYFLILFLFIISGYLIAPSFRSFFLDEANETFMHRFSGFLMLRDLNELQLFWGESNLMKVKGALAVTASAKFTALAGLGGFIVHYGIIFLFVFFAFIRSFGVKASGLIVILLCTMNVDPVTNQNFVTLGYFVAIYFMGAKNFSDRIPKMTDSAAIS